MPDFTDGVKKVAAASLSGTPIRTGSSPAMRSGGSMIPDAASTLTGMLMEMDGAWPVAEPMLVGV